VHAVTAVLLSSDGDQNSQWQSLITPSRRDCIVASLCLSVYLCAPETTYTMSLVTWSSMDRIAFNSAIIRKCRRFIAPTGNLDDDPALAAI